MPLLSARSTRLTPSQRWALPVTLLLALVVTVLLPPEPASAMQNIKCIKEGVGERLAAWSSEAAALGETIEGGSERWQRSEPETLVSALSGLIREGDRVSQACLSCGATRHGEQVARLTEQMQRHLHSLKQVGAEADARFFSALADTLTRAGALR